MSTEIETGVIKSKFYEAVSKTLEEFAFLEVLEGEADSACPDDPGAVFFTRLPIYAPFRAAMGLVVPIGMAASMMENIFGTPVDPVEDEFKIIDAQCEIVNTVAGNLMTRLLPPDESFELGLPECRYIADTQGQKDWAGSEEFEMVWDDAAFWGIWED